MEMPEIEYDHIPVSVQKIAHDLALAYAKSKLDCALANKKDFESAYVYEEINEIEYLYSHFLYALQYLSGIQPGEIEFQFKRYANGEPPPRM